MAATQKNITILASESLQDIKKLTQEQRKLVFDKMSENITDIPAHHFNAFNDMMTQYIDDEIEKVRPIITELLLRRIVQLSREKYHELNTIIIPVIGRKDHSVSGAIKVRFDYRVLTVMFDINESSDATKNIQGGGLQRLSEPIDYIVPTNEEVSISGLVVNQMCGENLMIAPGKLLTSIDCKQILQPTNNSLTRLLTSGLFRIDNLSNACGYFYSNYPFHSVRNGQTDRTTGVRSGESVTDLAERVRNNKVVTDQRDSKNSMVSMVDVIKTAELRDNKQLYAIYNSLIRINQHKNAMSSAVIVALAVESMLGIIYSDNARESSASRRVVGLVELLQHMRDSKYSYFPPQEPAKTEIIELLEN